MGRTRRETRDGPAGTETIRRAGHLIRHRWWARIVALIAVLALVAFLPVPWLVAQTPNPPGMAWRLDGRLQFDGHTIDPPGSWVGLTAGRPPVVAEVVYSWLDSESKEPRDMRTGSNFSSPTMAEPAAIAIGLIEAGVAVDVTTLIEAREPLVDGLPARISVSQINGKAISTRDDWVLTIDGLGERNEIITTLGRVLVFTGDTFPYGRIDMMQSPIDLEVSLAGWARLIPDGLYRNLALGRSHGLLLALAAYADATDTDFTRGLVIGATGVIRGDGAVGRIGGLTAKARAADGVGVDVLFYPAAQQCQEAAVMEALGSTSMRMIPVASLADAIAALRGDPLATGDGPTPCDA